MKLITKLILLGAAVVLLLFLGSTLGFLGFGLMSTDLMYGPVLLHAGAGGAYTVLHRHHRLPSEKRRFLPFGGVGRRITLRPCRSGRGDFYTICSRWQQSGASKVSSSARKAG